MKQKIDNGILAMILGGLTLILFSARPYILDLIEPARSIGQIVGENAKNLYESIKGEGNLESVNSKRAIWYNLLTILSFIMFVATIVLSIITIQNRTRKWYGIGGGMLAIVGLGVYLSHLAMGLIGFVLISILTVIVVGVLFFTGA